MFLRWRGLGKEFVSCKAAVVQWAWSAQKDVGSTFTVGNVVEDVGADIHHHVVVNKSVID